MYKSLYFLLSGDCHLILGQGSWEDYFGFDLFALREEVIIILESKNSSTFVPELGSLMQHSEAGLTYDGWQWVRLWLMHSSNGSKSFVFLVGKIAVVTFSPSVARSRILPIPFGIEGPAVGSGKLFHCCLDFSVSEHRCLSLNCWEYLSCKYQAD